MTHEIEKMPEARLGHANLKVSDLNRALAFYEGILGMRVTKRIGDQAAFLAFGSYHHDICLNTWLSAGAPPAEKHAAGLYHLAVLYPSRAALLQSYHALCVAGVVIDALVDHGITQSIYLQDPDRNGIELYWDRPPESWSDAAGQLQMGHRPITAVEFLA